MAEANPFTGISEFLEKLGYTVEEQGRISKYLVISKDGPIGFLMPDLSVKLVPGENQEGISRVITFFKKNHSLQSTGIGEFILATFRGSQLTTFYDTKLNQVRYSVYVMDANGTVETSVYESYDMAAIHFVTQTNLVDLRRLTPKHVGLRSRLRARLLRHLLAKSKSEANLEAV